MHFKERAWKGVPGEDQVELKGTRKESKILQEGFSNTYKPFEMSKRGFGLVKQISKLFLFFKNSVCKAKRVDFNSSKKGGLTCSSNDILFNFLLCIKEKIFLQLR